MLRRLFNKQSARIKGTVQEIVESPEHYAAEWHFARVELESGQTVTVTVHNYGERPFEVGDCITGCPSLEWRDFQERINEDGTSTILPTVMGQGENLVLTLEDFDHMPENESILEYQRKKLMCKIFEIQAHFFNHPSVNSRDSLLYDPLAALIGKWAGRKATAYGSDKFDTDGSYKPERRIDNNPEQQPV